jgi:hypothetical protein
MTKKSKSPEKATKSKKAPALPKGVTEKPRNPEEMDLGLIKDNPLLVRAYLPTSDNQGEWLQNKELMNRVAKTWKELLPLKEEEIKDPKKLLPGLTSLAKVFMGQISFCESIVHGTSCKYRIHQGLLFLALKKVVKATKQNWEDYFDKNFNPKERRSAQDAMRLAKAKNIIRYAVLGKFRLLQILRQIENFEDQEDPVGTYLADNGVEFNPEEEIDFDEIKRSVTATIGYGKCVDAGLKEISKKMVEALVSKGKEVESKHIRDMQALQELHGDVVKYFDGLISSDEKPEPVLTGERKADIFKKTADKFLKAIETAFADAEYLGGIDQEFCNTIKEKVLELEGKVVPN